MREYELSKQAIKKLKNLSKNDPKLATQVAYNILNLRKDLIKGESLTGFTLYKKIRVRNYPEEGIEDYFFEITISNYKLFYLVMIIDH